MSEIENPKSIFCTGCGYKIDFLYKYRGRTICYKCEPDVIMDNKENKYSLIKSFLNSPIVDGLMAGLIGGSVAVVMFFVLKAIVGLF